MTTMAHALAASRRFLVKADVDLIMEAVRTLPVDRPVLVADLGAGSGTTALSVFCARSENITVITVDHDPVALASTRQCMTNAGFVANWLGVERKTADDPGIIRPESLDMLMVDADHEYEAVRADLTTWLPLVRPGAPVWLHDATDLYPGTVQAIDEAVAAGLLAPVKAAGWGWLGKKPEVTL